MTRENSQSIQIPFPINGIDENYAYVRQPEATSPDAQNVRAYDSILRRLRGGSRPGLSKWFDSQIESTNGILDLNRISTTPSEAQGSLTILPVGQTQASEQVETINLDDGTQADVFTSTGTTSVQELVRDYAGNIYCCGELSNDTKNCWKLNADDLSVAWSAYVGAASTLTSIDYDPNTHRLVVTGSRAADNDQLWIVDPDNGAELDSCDPQGVALGSLFQVRFDSTGNIYIANRSATQNSWKCLIKYNRDLTELWSWWAKQSSSYCEMQALFITSDDGVIVGGQESDEWDDTEGGTDTNDKNIWGFDSDGNLLWSYLTDDGGGGASVNYVEAIFQTSGESDKVYIGKDGGTDLENLVKIDISDTASITEDWTYQISTTTSHEVQAIDEDEDGNIIIGGNQTATWAGAGGTANIWRLNADDGSLHSNSNWPVNTGATVVNDFSWTLKSNSYTSISRQSALTIVMIDGDIYAIRDGVKVTPSNGSEQLTNVGSELPFSQPAFGKMFFIDGINEIYYVPYSDTDDDEISLWIPTDGQLPINPKLMALYRGRIVLSGCANDPHNWYMSKVGDPFNFQYFPATATAIQAVAGNNSEAGLIGDFITAIMPYSDDLLLFGCDHTLWAMSGDPAAGGSIDRISDKTGVAWGKAWTTGPKGELYFAGTDGIYKFVPGESIENITDKRMKTRFDNIDRDNNYIILEWDYLQQGLMVLIVDKGWSVSSAQTTYFWEERTGAWWIDVYPTTMGPLCLYAYDDDDADDTAFLMGCADGYIRKSDFTVGNDDGTSIASYVKYPPLYLQHDVQNTKLTELHSILAENSESVDLLLTSAESVERLINNATTRFKRALVAGRNFMKPRISTNVIGMELNKTSSNRWAIESMNAVVSTQGKVRRTRSS